MCNSVYLHSAPQCQIFHHHVKAHTQPVKGKLNVCAKLKSLWRVMQQFDMCAQLKRKSKHKCVVLWENQTGIAKKVFK